MGNKTQKLSNVVDQIIEWQVVVTADGSTGLTAVAGRGYFIDTTSGAITVTLPASPKIGDKIAIKDYAGTFATNVVTIGRNGNNIQGAANNSEILTNRASVELVYIDSTKGWLFTNESNVADLGAALFITATGGTIATSGDFKIHSFTGDGCFVVSQVGNPVGGGSTVDYLVVAGGGGGAGGYGGGGGAGGFRTTFPSPGCNAGAFPISATTYPITVGSGGAGACGSGSSGSNSVFSTITSAGGGYGGAISAVTGGSGGSGGGGGGCGSGSSLSNGGTGNTPPVNPPQGNNGGGGFGVSVSASAGAGGGAGGTGGNASNGVGGAGGVGTTNSITNSPVSYSGGGGGGTTSPSTGGSGSPCGTGGTGGGNSAGSAGTTNRGGGGGGGGGDCVGGIPKRNGYAGGSGIVVIRYKFQ